MSSSRKQSFVELLARRIGVSPSQLPGPTRWSGAGNTIGGIALRTGLLNMNQLERILEEQGRRTALFGQIAVELGFLTKDKVDRLLSLQCVHYYLEQGEAAVLLGWLDAPAMLACVRDFLEGDVEVAGS